MGVPRRDRYRLTLGGLDMDYRYQGLADRPEAGPEEQRVQRESERIERAAERAARVRPPSGPVRLSE